LHADLADNPASLLRKRKTRQEARQKNYGEGMKSAEHAFHWGSPRKEKRTHPEI
jgi:hypothetical protein